ERECGNRRQEPQAGTAGENRGSDWGRFAGSCAGRALGREAAPWRGIRIARSAPGPFPADTTRRQAAWSDQRSEERNSMKRENLKGTILGLAIAAATGVAFAQAPGAPAPERGAAGTDK